MKFIFPVIFCVGCVLPQTTQTPIPPFNGGSASVCEAACTRRKELNCLEKQFEPICVQVCEEGYRARLYNPNCVLDAETKERLETVCKVECFSN
jgi:hypothetical protein